MSREIVKFVEVGKEMFDEEGSYAEFLARTCAIDLAIREIEPIDVCVTRRDDGSSIAGIKLTVEGIAPQEEA